MGIKIEDEEAKAFEIRKFIAIHELHVSIYTQFYVIYELYWKELK